MIPILYRNEETNFVTNGIGRLSDCISCIVMEERNGAYECECKYPISGERYKDIENGCIIYCTHDETRIPQAFVIYGHSAPINGVVTFYAHHISYKLSKLVVMPFIGTSIQDTFNKLKLNISTANNFTFWTDKTTVGNYTLDVPTTVRGMLGGQEGSILDIYGTGDYEWDMFTVKLHANRGQDSGVEIRYGKNLVDITDEVDGGEVYNAIVPYWKSSDESGTVVTLPESVLVYSEATRRLVDLTDHLLNILRTQGGEPLEVPISIKEVIPLDLSQEFEEQPTVAELRTKATSTLETSGGWNPSQNITVDFVALWQTEEYKDFAPLQRVKLCDTVSVYYPELGVNAEKKKVVKTTYNVLLERYDEIELGDLQYSFSQIVAESLKEEVPTSSMMQSAIDNATKLITGGLGGHVYLKPNANGYPEEILVMDDSDYTQANKLWRWNLNGLGYSNGGYNGQYGTAITMDGQIVADFITAGTLNANIIKAGVLSDVNGNTAFNLNTGTLTIRKGSINLGDGSFTVDNFGELTASKVTIGNFKISSNVDSRYALYADWGHFRTWIRTANEDYQDGAWAFSTQVLASDGYHGVTGITSQGEVFIHPVEEGTTTFSNSWSSFETDYIRLSLWNSSNVGGDLRLDEDMAKLSYSGTRYMLLSSTGVSLWYNSNRYFNMTSGGFTLWYDANRYISAMSDYMTMRYSSYVYLMLESSGVTMRGGNGDAWYTQNASTITLSSAKAEVLLNAYGLTLITGRQTTAHSGNLYITTAGIAYFANEGSSSRKIKHDIKPVENAELNPERLYDAEVIQYKYNDDFLSEDDPNKGIDLAGFIVEDLDKVYPSVVQKEDEKESKTWTWSPYRIIPPMLKLIQDQHKEIEKLKQKLS